MLYRPRLSDGKPAPLTWPLALYRLVNILCWPVEDNASRLAYTIDRICWILLFVICACTNEAEIRYLRANIDNLDELLAGVPTYLVLVEFQFRGFTLGARKEKYKKLLQKFYAEIYIEKSSHPHLFKSIQRQFLPILVFSFFYLNTLLVHALVPIYMISTGRRDLLYKMILPFDHRPLPIYIVCIFCNIWSGFVVTSLLFGEANMLATLMFHLNGRYRIMRENLEDKVDKILKAEGNDNIVERYRQILVATLNENVRLNQFAQQIQAEYSFRLFITFAFMAASLCAVGLKVYINPITNIAYVFWTVGKVQEILSYGQMGTTMGAMTDSISSMYYESKWEAIIERSSDVKANVRLMKLVNVAIIMNRKPFYLTGLNFFAIALSTAVTMLQCASSYFTCLISFR